MPLFLYTSAWVTQKCLDLNQTGFKMESMGAPNPEPQSAVSRSEESFSSRTSTPAPKAIGTGRYWVTLPQPDGRRILVNYKGTIDSSKGDLLPVQPPGGADNAMYLDLGTGYSWIWTVPAGASNIAQWIDP